MATPPGDGEHQTGDQTCRPSTLTTTTTTTISSTFGHKTNPVTSGYEDRSPFEDSRIGWIHELNKESLVQQMSRYGLDTTGNVAELRKRFANFWKNPLGNASLFTSNGERNTVSGDNKTTEQSRWEWPVPPASCQAWLDEFGSVREILGLSPNADSAMVKRTLARVTRQAEMHERGWTEPPTLQSGTQVTYSSQWKGALTQATAERFEHGLSEATNTVHSRKDWAEETRPNAAHTNAPIAYGRREWPGHGQPLSMPMPTPTIYGRSGGLQNNPPLIMPSLTNSHPNRSDQEFPYLCNLVRKWNLRFDGRKEPITFLERLEELIDSYSLSRDEVVRTMPELLTGPALLWYRNCKDEWRSYQDFRRHFEAQFLPRGYQNNLEDEIRKRTQGENETFRDFVQALSTLMRRSGSFSVQRKVDTIFENMRPDYKLMVRRADFYDLNDLTAKAEEYEAFEQARKNFRPPPPPSQALVPETAYFHRRRVDRVCEGAMVEKITNHEVPETFATDQKGTNPTQQSDFAKKSGVKDQIQKTRTVTFEERGEARKMDFPRNRTPPRKSGHPIANPATNLICWNCDQAGHLFRDCPLPKVIRCFRCKTQGVTTKRCQCRSGNGTWVRK